MGELALNSAAEILGRRSFMRSAACAGLWAAAPMLGCLTEPAKAANWRGLVGCVKPRANDSALVDMIKLLPRNRRGARLSKFCGGYTRGISEQLR